MANDGDVARLRWHYVAFNAGDVEASVQTVAVDIRIRLEPGASMIGGDVTGHDEMRGFYRSMLDTVGGMEVEPLEFVELGDRVMVPVRITGRARSVGFEGSQDLVHMWTLRDGLPAQLHVYVDAAQARADLEANRPPAWASPEPGDAPL